MASKRPLQLDPPPPVFSSEEEDVDSSEEEDASSSEDEQPPPQPNVSSPLPDGSSSDFDTDSESDGPTTISRFNLKPNSSKAHMEEASPSKKARAKTSAANAKLAKRSSEIERDLKDSKRAKKKEPEADGVGDETKKQLFQRLWSEDDEIEILKGMIEDYAKKGADPLADMNAFHEFIKKSVHVDFSRAQLLNKVRRLKKKYENNTKGKMGEYKTFAKENEQKGFELSKKIWGKDGFLTSMLSASQTKSDGKVKENKKGNGLGSLKAKLFSSPEPLKEVKKKVEIEGNSLEHSMGSIEMIGVDKSFALSSYQGFAKHGLDLIDGQKRGELEEKWKKLHMTELEVFLKRTELIQEQTKLVLDAYKSTADS